MVVVRKENDVKYYIGECGSSGRQFDTLPEFLKAIKDLAQTYEENGEDWFEIEVAND